MTNNFYLILKIAFLVCVSSGIYSQNLIPDSSFSHSISRLKNESWNTQITKTGIFIDTLAKKDSSNWDKIWLKRTLACDAQRVDFLHFRPLDFPTPFSTHFFSDVVYCELTEPLIADSIYNIGMWVFPADFLSVPSFQIYFSETELFQVDKIKKAHRVDLYREDSCAIINTVMKVEKTGRITQETHYSGWEIQFENKWFYISGKYKAKGGERFFYIGNVNQFEYIAYDFNVKKHKLSPRKDNNPQKCPGNAFDFFIDDVSVRK